MHPVAIPEDKDEVQPTRSSALVFHAKANVLRLRRMLKDPHGKPRPLPLAKAEAPGTLIAESRTPLFPSGTGAEFALQAGKVQNLRSAARHLNGRQLRAGHHFSFWAHIPRPTASRGFALGRESRSGCVIPSVGGGLRQLSNALYGLALDAGWEIVERHTHTLHHPASRPRCNHLLELRRSPLSAQHRLPDLGRSPANGIAGAATCTRGRALPNASHPFSCTFSRRRRHP